MSAVMLLDPRSLDEGTPSPSTEQRPVSCAHDATALAALAELLEPLAHWLSVTRSPLHRLEIVELYAQLVPQDAALVANLHRQGSYPLEGLSCFEREKNPSTS